MSRQTYEEIEKLLFEINDLNIHQIKHRLSNLLIDPCEYCKVRCNTISKYGRELNSNSAGGSAGSYIYNVCSNCNEVLSWTM